MMKYRPILLFTIFLVTALLLSGCGQKDIYGINYQDQLRLLIEENPDGMELYSLSVYPDSTASFKLDTTDDLYFYVVDNVARTMAYDINTKLDTLFGFYNVVDAIVTIDDKYTGKVYRIRGADTSRAYGLESHLQRFAYFLKLYDDAHQYGGWRFWAYSCLNYTPDGYFKSISGDSLPVDRTKLNIADGIYRRLGEYVVEKQDIVRLPANDSIDYYSRYHERIFAEDVTGSFKAYTNNLSQGAMYYTGWRIPGVSERYYHLITIDSDTTGYNFREVKNIDGEVVDSIMVKTGDIVVPYSIGD
jgi:hypothetical protein